MKTKKEILSMIENLKSEKWRAIEYADPNSQKTRDVCAVSRWSIIDDLSKWIHNDSGGINIHLHTDDMVETTKQ